jgi:hypothetical protein
MNSSETANECYPNVEQTSGVVKMWNALRKSADEMDAQASRAEAEGRRTKARNLRGRAGQYRCAAGETPQQYFRTKLPVIADYEQKAAAAEAAGDLAFAGYAKSLADRHRASSCGFDLDAPRDAYTKLAARVSIGLNAGMVALLGRLGVPRASWAPALSLLLEEALCAVEDSGQPVANQKDPSCTRILHKLTAGPEIYYGDPANGPPRSSND